MPKRINKEAQRSRRRGATSTVVLSMPLGFKGLDKNVVLLGPLKHDSVWIRKGFGSALGGKATNLPRMTV